MKKSHNMMHRFSKRHIRRKVVEKLTHASLLSSIFAVIAYSNGYEKVSWYPIPFILFIFGVITITTYKNQLRLLKTHEVKVEPGKLVIHQFPSSLSLDLSVVDDLIVHSRRASPKRIIGKMDKKPLFDLKGYERMDVLADELRRQLKSPALFPDENLNERSSPPESMRRAKGGEDGTTD